MCNILASIYVLSKKIGIILLAALIITPHTNLNNTNGTSFVNMGFSEISCSTGNEMKPHCKPE